MKLNKKEVIYIAKKQLAMDFACDVNDFDKRKNTVLDYKELEGRRIFSKEDCFLRLVTFGNGAIVSCDKSLQQWCNRFFKYEDGINCFEHHIMSEIDIELKKYNKKLNLVHELYLPCGNYEKDIDIKFKYKVFEKDEIKQLYKDNRFSNALVYDVNSLRPDVLAVVAYNESDEVIGVSGAGEDCKSLWQIGVDVLPKYRGKGLGKSLVYILTKEVLRKGAIPYYGTWASNIASRNIAQECGYFPAWIEMYSIDK